MLICPDIEGQAVFTADIFTGRSIFGESGYLHEITSLSCQKIRYRIQRIR